jgi:hypothetical protein
MVVLYKGAVKEQLKRLRDRPSRAWRATLIAYLSWIPASVLYNLDVFGRVSPGVRWTALLLILASAGLHLYLLPNAVRRMRTHFDGRASIFLPAMFLVMSCLFCASFLLGIVQRLSS